MSIRVALNHITHYRYDRLVALGPQVLRLRPAPHTRTPVIAYSMRVEPADHFVNWQQDAFANYQARLVFPEKTREFKVTVDLVVEMAVYNPFDFFLEPSAEEFPFKYEPHVATELAPYLVKSELTPRLKQFVESIDTTPTGTTNFLVALNQRLQSEIAYIIRMEPGVQTPEETLEKALGSCRDTSWLLVQTLRHLGLAARFVSGYLIQLTPDQRSLDGPSGTEVDFTDLHAWCEVYLPGAGWIGFDPTSGLLAGEGHIPVACTPEPGSAAPISGAVDKSEVEFEHLMSIERVLETPRVTKPYTEEVWSDVLAMGAQVDRRLTDMDVRLTMGGEPTFVAVRDRDAAEWNTDALGPTKRGYAVGLMDKLRARYGVGGFVHIGQGKWYPGEQLPRWAMSLYWRADGQPVWSDPTLFADEREPGAYTAEDAHRFILHLTNKLALDTKHVQAGYEDTFYYLWRERKLPVNVDPFESELDDELERVRLRRVFDAGLARVTGYVLPITRERDIPMQPPHWVSGPWFFRDDRMYLIPGDSPMGYRLPLDSLPWVSAGDYPYQHPVDPFGQQAPLRSATELRMQYGGGTLAAGVPGAVETAGWAGVGGLGAGSGTGTGTGTAATPAAAVSREPARGESASWIRRTALCVEARNPARAAGPKVEAESFGSGHSLLHVFMPPLTEIDDYLDLLAAVEATAADLRMKVIIEGYPPPRDQRLKLLQVTPDPGVIEVNIHPAANWDELVDHTEYLYQSAHETYLSTEKFMTDGRHTGTGGGNHFVLGGATPADSPFLRRPDLLASLIAYFINHPSLSYLFSGLFLGPTSQAPRVDEARNDQLYELEIAFNELQRQLDLLGGRDSAKLPPWLVDRTLRNLLIDVTGNTHRAEFCIDKLYSPDGPTGRLGLLELRGFEMPPHARMSLVQQLLLRALVARFWEKPYTTRLTRWGTELHDRFMLGSFIRMDFEDVIADINASGFAFDAAWFAPHFEFRFPLVGTVQSSGIELTVRNALEPWHVMGEEGAPGGTVRYVDSSVERLEVHVLGLNSNRHVVTVNGVPLPLQPTGRASEHVAGVRFRAWQQSSALHPSIGVDAPLTFDVIDTWNKRSIGGCRYHVSHPGGRNYGTFPVNAYEAESRRRARFFKSGHTPGRVNVGEPQRSFEFPFTLDLRRWR
ncbi:MULTISPECIES: transglutaminase family protein [unclassified Caballeronia]|uniref:transglutaminase family protein n=1 Tax=unclassified Caballeronia TaxID=2646786 RepID=UPI00286185BF|nr:MULTISPECIES: transglutaminase family protein [unclassified Caballeronia]MDR5752981.1 transglutaminase family protein [Caballeronia sp. LZ024]MDR5841268.1 transglutaminase family protein [Caballeronia sp. LZ031]